MRYYSSQAPAVDLTGSITNLSTSMTVSSTTGFPGTTPFTLVIDPGQPTEEIVEVTNVSGLTLTITRAVDGSSAQAHSASVGNVRHMATARDYREPQDHIAASTNIHGLAAGAAVVGTTSTQTLTNKTLQASAAGAVGAVVKGTASQTASYFEVQDNTGAVIAKVQPGVGTLTVGSAQVNGAGADNLFGFLAKFTSSAAGIVTGIFKRATGQTADILQIQNESAVVLAKFDKDANLSVPSLASSGAVSGTTGSFSAQVTSNGVNAVTLSETQTLTNKTLTDPIIGGTAGTISAASAAFTGNVTAGNLPAVPSGKAGKKVFWGIASGTTDSNGFLIVTHGAGFTPSVVVPVSNVNLSISFGTVVGVDSIGAPTFRLRFFNFGSGLPLASTAVSCMFFCGE